jgi:hypothetical protein
MSNTPKKQKTVRKRKVIVQEVEEVQKVDRRGNSKVSLRPVRKNPAVPKQIPPHNQKRARLKSPSPVASGSDHYFQRQKPSKVCIE